MTLDFSQIESAQRISAEWVLSRVQDTSIFRTYFGEFSPYKKSYLSVFRKETNPSTGFFYTPSGKLKYKDFATGESWDCFSFVGQLYGISYYEAVKRVACDFGLMACESLPLDRKIIKQSTRFDERQKKDTIIQIVPDKWNVDHLLFWSRFEITQTELEKEGIIPIKELYVNKQYIKGESVRFAFPLMVNGQIRFKIYSPYSSFKWLSNIPISCPFGLDKLDDGGVVIVSKAVKEKMLFQKFFKSVIAVQNESEGALPDDVVKKLLNFPKRIIVFDADTTGVEACKKYNSRGFGYLNSPRNLLSQGIKDFGEFVERFGVKGMEQFLKYKGLL